MVDIPEQIPPNIFRILADIDEDGFRSGVAEEPNEKWKRERIIWRRLRAGRHAYYDAKWKAIREAIENPVTPQEEKAE